MDRLTLLKSFTTVVDCGSFSKAAELLGSTQSQISKHIKTLEENLCVALFTRTTRQLSLTEEGEKLLNHARNITDQFEAAQQELRGDKTQPQGKLRVLTSDGTGRTLFIDALVKFLQLYPLIQVDHIMRDQFMGLVENQIDVAIWLGAMPDSTYKIKRIGEAKRITVATPEYLKARGIPKKPADLLYHDCIVFTHLSAYTGIPHRSHWQFIDAGGNTEEVQISGRYSVDNTSQVREAVLSHLGIYNGPDYLFAEAIKNRKIKVILQNYSSPAFPIQIVYPNRGFITERQRALIEFMAKNLVPSSSVTAL